MTSSDPLAGSYRQYAASRDGKFAVQALHRSRNALVPLEPEEVVALGTVLTSSQAIAHTEDYAEVARSWAVNPWCPVLLSGNQPPQLRVFAPITPEGMRLNIVHEPGILLNPAELLASVPAVVPTDAQLCIYVGLRRGGAVRWALTRALLEPGYNRELRGQQLPPSGVWVATFTTVRCLATAVIEGLSEEEAAERCALRLKTLSRYCGDHFGLSWRELKALEHWEAMLEQALRHKGLVPVPTIGPRR